MAVYKFREDANSASNPLALDQQKNEGIKADRANSEQVVITLPVVAVVAPVLDVAPAVVATDTAVLQAAPVTAPLDAGTVPALDAATDNINVFENQPSAVDLVDNNAIGAIPVTTGLEPSALPAVGSTDVIEVPPPTSTLTNAEALGEQLAQTQEIVAEAPVVGAEVQEIATVPLAPTVAEAGTTIGEPDVDLLLDGLDAIEAEKALLEEKARTIRTELRTIAGKRNAQTVPVIDAGMGLSNVA